VRTSLSVELYGLQTFGHEERAASGAIITRMMTMTDKIDYSKRPDPKDPTQPAPNISTRNTEPGDAKRPADDLGEIDPASATPKR
jgi:hypothetical protein